MKIRKLIQITIVDTTTTYSLNSYLFILHKNADNAYLFSFNS